MPVCSIGEGWFPTKDGGYLDVGGFLFVEGRIDDVIVRGGENLSPGEIEDVLLQHPSVREACVLGVPDTEWGEIVAAVVVAADGADRQPRRTAGVGHFAAAIITRPGTHRSPRRTAVQRHGQGVAPSAESRTLLDHTAPLDLSCSISFQS